MSHKAYAFDIDDNLLHTKATVFLEKRTKKGWRKRIEIPESELKKKIHDRDYRYPNNDIEDCFHHMRGPGKIKEHLFEALENGRTGPSWEKFKHANKEASPIALITARGHPIQDIRDAHHAMLLEAFDISDLKEFLENINKRLEACESEDLRHFLKYHKKNENKMLNLFLDMNYYAPCSDLEYLKTIHMGLWSGIPERKVQAFQKFITHIVELNSKKLTNPENKALKIWFSDDSLDNLSAMETAIQTDLIHRYPEISLMLYDTNNADFVKKTIYSYK